MSRIIRTTLIIAGAALTIGAPGAADQQRIGLGLAATLALVGCGMIYVGIRMKGRK